MHPIGRRRFVSGKWDLIESGSAGSQRPDVIGAIRVVTIENNSLRSQPIERWGQDPFIAVAAEVTQLQTVCYNKQNLHIEPFVKAAGSNITLGKYSWTSSCGAIRPASFGPFQPTAPGGTAKHRLMKGAFVRRFGKFSWPPGKIRIAKDCATRRNAWPACTRRCFPACARIRASCCKKLPRKNTTKGCL